MIKRWFTGLTVFLIWLPGFALALVGLALWHEACMAFLGLIALAAAPGARLLFFSFAWKPSLQTQEKIHEA